MSSTPVADAFNVQCRLQQQGTTDQPSSAIRLPITPKPENVAVDFESPLSGTEGSLDGSVVSGTKRSAPDASADGQSSKPKQKRNKPTLSCVECVERKTKVRRCHGVVLK